MVRWLARKAGFLLILLPRARAQLCIVDDGSCLYGTGAGAETCISGDTVYSSCSNTVPTCNQYCQPGEMTLADVCTFHCTGSSEPSPPSPPPSPPPPSPPPSPPPQTRPPRAALSSHSGREATAALASTASAGSWDQAALRSPPTAIVARPSDSRPRCHRPCRHRHAAVAAHCRRRRHRRHHRRRHHHPLLPTHRSRRAPTYL